MWVISGVNILIADRLHEENVCLALSTIINHQLINHELTVYQPFSMIQSLLFIINQYKKHHSVQVQESENCFKPWSPGRTWELEGVIPSRSCSLGERASAETGRASEHLKIWLFGLPPSQYPLITYLPGLQKLVVPWESTTDNWLSALRTKQCVWSYGVQQ